MILLYWLLLSISGLGMLACIYSVLRVRAYYGRDKTNIPYTASQWGCGDKAGGGLSVIIPLKGGDIRTEIHLRQLLMSELYVPLECIFVMENKPDPAHKFCLRVVRDYPRKLARILLTTPHLCHSPFCRFAA